MAPVHAILQIAAVLSSVKKTALQAKAKTVSARIVIVQQLVNANTTLQNINNSVMISGRKERNTKRDLNFTPSLTKNHST